MARLTTSDLHQLRSDILYLIGSEGLILVFLQNNKYKALRSTMSQIEAELERQHFVCINRNCIINTKFLVGVHPEKKHEIIMSNGATFKASRRRFKRFQ